MWKRPEEITAHNQSQGRDQFDPAQWIHTFVAEVETIWLEGDRVILAGCCESVSVKREDVIAWRELPGREGRASTYEVRMKKGADAIAQFQGDKRTWEWPVGSLTLRFQLDHLMHDAHFVPVTARIVEAGRSDHKPIWADFERIDP